MRCFGAPKAIELGRGRRLCALYKRSILIGFANLLLAHAYSLWPDPCLCTDRSSRLWPINQRVRPLAFSPVNEDGRKWSRDSYTRLAFMAQRAHFFIISLLNKADRSTASLKLFRDFLTRVLIEFRLNVPFIKSSIPWQYAMPLTFSCSIFKTWVLIKRL